jgi:hypothetical protein
MFVETSTVYNQILIFEEKLCMSHINVYVRYPTDQALINIAVSSQNLKMQTLSEYLFRIFGTVSLQCLKLGSENGIVFVSECSLFTLCIIPQSTLKLKSHLCVPRKGTAWPQSQFLHSCVCARFIYSRDRSTFFPTAE